jgi:hypothetical protein
MLIATDAFGGGLQGMLASRSVAMYRLVKQEWAAGWVMTRNEPPADQGGASGCLGLGLLFVGTTISTALVTLFAYVLVVEQFALIAVRREFSYEMGLVWAPLAGLLAGIAALFWALRSRASAKRTGYVAGMMMLSAVALMALVVALGMI